MSWILSQNPVPSDFKIDQILKKAQVPDLKTDEQSQEQQSSIFPQKLNFEPLLEQKSQANKKEVNDLFQEIMMKQSQGQQSDKPKQQQEKFDLFADQANPNSQRPEQKAQSSVEQKPKGAFGELLIQQASNGQYSIFSNKSQNSILEQEKLEQARQKLIQLPQSQYGPTQQYPCNPFIFLNQKEKEQAPSNQNLKEQQQSQQSQSSAFQIGQNQQSLSKSLNQLLAEQNQLSSLQPGLLTVAQPQNPSSKLGINDAVLSKEHLNQVQIQRNQQQQQQLLGQQQIQQQQEVREQGYRLRQNQQNQDYISLILEQILHHKLHYDPNYTRIYGIKHDVQYLRDVQRNFECYYQDFIKFLQGKQTLIRWYEEQIKIFHQQFGIPVIIDSFWQNYIDNSQIFTVQCRLELFNSDPFKNFISLREYYSQAINEYINLQDDISKQKFFTMLEYSWKPQIVDIHLIYLLSVISGMNVMVHEDQIPTKEPILIANGKEVSSEDFPNFNIIQLYTTDFKLYYQIVPSTQEDKTKLDQYIHYDVRMQEINYREVAQHKLEQLQKKENEGEQNINQNYEGEHNLDKLFKSIEKKIQKNIKQYEQQEKLEDNENSKDFQEMKVEKKQEDLD
ncbi:hypothetical protein pb186bvf_018940 [Paramecium bursaria]